MPKKLCYLPLPVIGEAYAYAQSEIAQPFYKLQKRS